MKHNRIYLCSSIQSRTFNFSKYSIYPLILILFFFSPDIVFGQATLKKAGNFNTGPFPILIDAGAQVSKGLRLFTPDWNNGRGPMNIPTVFIIDKNGILQFKYLSQVTFDRPGFDYLSKILACLENWGK